MSKNFTHEREGQIQFFNDLRIQTEVELHNNTDGVYRGTIFEFKLSIANINKVLSQAIKYLSHMRIKGESIPQNILLVALNEEKAYLFDSQHFLAQIEVPYMGAASRLNDDFDTSVRHETIDYSNIEGLQRLATILQTDNFIKVHIDLYDVVGWTRRFYNEVPSATKITLFDELRNPVHFKELVYPWEGEESEFKYIMDLLNDKMHRKELGAFYTPPAYAKKSLELVRAAIAQVPSGNDYIILDRCAGTGNLEEFLTDKNVDDITVGELAKYLDAEVKGRYLRDKADVITTFYSDKNFNDLTMRELEQYATSMTIHDHLFDNELSHTVVNTYELKEWIVLNERIGDKVKMIIPPAADVTGKDPLVNGGDALSEHFVNGQGTIGLSEEYDAAITMLRDSIADNKTNIILYENPPYRDEAAKIKNANTSKSFVYEQFKLDGTNEASHRELANLFIWSGWRYYLKKPNDAYVLFSPIKYWKSLELGNKKFMRGFLFNRKYFHAGESSISCIAWLNSDESLETLTLEAIDINDKGTVENTDDVPLYLHDVVIKKVHRRINEHKDARIFEDDTDSDVFCDLDGRQSQRTCRERAKYNDNIVGYLRATSYNLDSNSVALTRTITYDALTQHYGFYLRRDNFAEKLPLFAAKLYPQKNWYERDVYFTTADGGGKYVDDNEFLKSCLIFACLSHRNHCRSFEGSDGRLYLNELCLDTNTVASTELSEYELSSDDQSLINAYQLVREEAKKTKNYDERFAYGTYQIDQELNTRHKDENGVTMYDYSELNTAIVSLRNKLAAYYEVHVQPKLFEYELLK